METHKESVFGTLGRLGFELGDQLETSTTLFATVDPNALFLEFRFRFQLRDVSGADRRDAILLLRGDGTYRPNDGVFTHLRNFGEEVKYVLQDGTEEERKNVVMFAGGIVLGHREVLHSVRYRL